MASGTGGIVFAPDGTPLVALEASGPVARLNGVSGAVLATASVGDHARHGRHQRRRQPGCMYRASSPRHCRGESTGASRRQSMAAVVRVLDVATLAPVATVVLRHDDDPDPENSGGGVPNYPAHR